MPVHYELVLEPDFDDFTFSGNVTIHIMCGKPTRTIRLDAAEITLKSCTVVCGDQTIPFTTHVDESAETLAIKTPQAIQGKCTIQLNYTGVLNDRLLGFYRSQYTDDNKTRYLATTQFEAADARRAFPCLDRPDCKATFDIAVKAPHGMEAISNMPAKSTTANGRHTTYEFQTTPVMSTYLVYVGVGKFEYIQSRDGRIRIITLRGKSKHGRYALEISEKLLGMYEEYFGVGYPLPKLDLIALPDFAAGAMENWGAITFRENLLLYDPENSSTATKQLVTEVVAHELVHQWFGNLVTMEWWNDLWLNESFATFMATKMVDRLYPEWKMSEQFVDDAMNTAMRMDSLESTHPIDVEVKSPSQIREIFDAISYDKGGCVLRMLEDFVGAENFQDGLRKYLHDFKYKNAAGSDLWDSLEHVCHRPIRDILEPWLNDSGFPLVDVTPAQGITLRQGRFYADGRDPGPGTWPIPLKIADGGANNAILFDKDRMHMESPGQIMVNAGRTGFYRVRYHGYLWDDILGRVADAGMAGIDRWAIQNDMFAFCLSGRASIPEYLGMVAAYQNETEYLPLSGICRGLEFFMRISRGEPWQARIDGAALPIFSGILERLGWSPHQKDAHTDAFLRTMSITACARLDNSVADLARDKFDAYLDDHATLHPDVRLPVMAAAAGRGSHTMHDRMVSLFEGAASIEEQLRILSAMCEFDDPYLLERTLDYSLTEHVRSQNAHTPAVLVASNPAGRHMFWPWLSRHWDDLEQKIGHGNPLFGRIIYGVAMIADDSYMDQIETFLADNPVPGTERTRQQALETLTIYSNLRRRAPAELSEHTS